MNKNNNTQKPITHSDTKKADVATNKQNAGGLLSKNDKSLNKDNNPTKQIALNRNSTPQIMNGTSDEKKQNGSQLNKQVNKKSSSTNNNNDVSGGDINSNKNGDIKVAGNANNSINTVPNRSEAADDSFNTIQNNKSQAANSGLAGSGQTNKNKNTNEKGNTFASVDTSNTNKIAIETQKESATTTKKMDLKHTTPIKTKGFYVGVAAGLDVTTVKFQKVNKIGYTANFIVGYRITNKWSLESGLMWDNKKYYSTGEYYNPKTPIPPDYNLHYLNGTCEMFEIPLNVKYDFRSRKLNVFFVAAGLSSYLMKKESYIGYVTHFSTPNLPGYDKPYVYKNATNNIFSVGNISGGYQFIFKNNSSFRIEPYLKIPLTGLGFGQMPFLSTGISAAYTLPLH